MSVRACRFLIDVSLRWDESGHTMHTIPLVPPAVHPASTRQLQSHFPQAFPKPGPEAEEGALLFPTSPLSTLTCGWELNQGYPLPEWVGYWKVLKNWPSLAQLQISHQSSAPVFDLLGAIKGSAWNLLCALEIKAGYPSWHKTNLFWGNHV